MSATEQDVAEVTVANVEVDGNSDPPVQVEAVTSDDEMERLDPTLDTYTFTDGTVVVLERLRTRQFFKLLRIITRGGVDVLQAVRLDPTQGVDVFTENLIALIVFAVPEAEDETVEFLRSMVKPEQVVVPDDVPPGNVAKIAKQMETAARMQVDREFVNPELDDLFGLVTVIVRREAPELKALGKRLADTLKFNQAVQPDSGTVPSSEDSQEPST